MIPVTKPFLPPKKEYDELLRAVWERNWLTNNGPLAYELELLLAEYLKVDRLCYLSNGTIALQIAIKVLRLQGEIITTPFSYVATVSSIVWEGCQPVFVDIDPLSFNIDPARIEDAITPRTSAILATHVYGNPCEIDSIGKIARKYNLKVIYDAAHCFGTKYKGNSVYKYGDISTASFHATKLYHTTEGGALFSPDTKIIDEVSWMRNFGHAGSERFNGLGINGKNSELHAAMGVVNLKHVDNILQRRRELSHYYDNVLDGLNISKPKIQFDSEFNHAYYPIVFETERQLLDSITALNNHGIFPRRYFYPDLTTLPYVKQKDLPIATKVSRCVLCLPLYHTLLFSEIDLIADILLRVQKP